MANMAYGAESERATNDRGTASVPSGKLRTAASERGIANRGAHSDEGNPGTRLGAESRDGAQYVRYRATVGTWISASLKQQGYDHEYGRLSGYGAYLGSVKDADGSAIKSPDLIEPGQVYLIPVRKAPVRRPVSFGAQLVTGYRWPQTQVQTKPEPESAMKQMKR